jgi:hypothetical protein
MGQGVCRKKKLWASRGRAELEALGLDSWARRRRQELLEILDRLEPSLAELDRAAAAQETEHQPAARYLMQQPGVGPVTALMFVLTIGPIERFLGCRGRTGSVSGHERWSPAFLANKLDDVRVLDPFVAVAAGRALFRVADLMELAKQVAALKSEPARRSAKEKIYVMSVINCCQDRP